MKQIYFIFLFMFSFSVFAQQVTVSGKVTNQNGESLPGATISEEGTINGVISDYNGNFELTLSSEDAMLKVSFVGFENQSIKVGSKRRFDFMLAESLVTMDEVEIKGFMGVVGKSRRRTESVQSIPESVTALNSEGIEITGVSDIRSFSTIVPNLSFSTSQAVGVNFITVRGVPTIKKGSAPVAFVIDGVTIPDPSLLAQEFYDLALVEVVKGPQGALYGKNAIGGAINIYTQDPTNQFKNKLKLGYGNGNSLYGLLTSTGAIVNDKVFFRLSALYKDTDGLLNNEYLNKKVDFMTDINIRGQLKAYLSDRISITGTYQYLKKDGGAAYYSVNPTGSIFDEGEPGGVLDPNPEDGNNVIVCDELGTSDMISNFASVNFEFNSSKIKFQSITAYNHVDRTTFGDLDFLPFDDFTQYEKSSTKTFNQEFRFQNNNTESKLNWSAGAFYQYVENPVYADGLVRDYDTWEQFNVVSGDLVNKNNTIAFFGFADYDITEKLTISAGLRYDIDQFDQEDYLFEVNSSRSNNEIQPKFSISYKATEGVLMYANYGRGYRTGGFNPAITDLFNRDYKDETTDNYEFGFKTSWWNNRLIVNGAVFYTDFTNQQQYILELTDFYVGIYNYDKSKIFGYELDTKLRITRFLDLLASYGFADAEIVEGGSVGGEDGNATDNSKFNGNKVPFVPVDNFNIGLASSFPLTKTLNFNAFVNLSSFGKTYWHESNLPQHTSDAYQLLNARIGLEFKSWEFELWGNNLMDTQYYEEFSPGEYVGSPDDVGWRGRPRSFGTTISFNF